VDKNSEIITVLLIEDNYGDALLIREMLGKVKDDGFTLEWAERLSTGLERLAKGDIDLVLLNLSLPDSSGIEPFAKTNAQAPHVPVIVLTSPEDEGVAVQALQEGAQDYLVKGQVNGNVLIRAIGYAIEHKRTEEALRTSQEQLQQAQKMKALGTLVAGVAHEINNPINLIMFNVPILKKIWRDFQPVLKEQADKEPDRKYGGLAYDFLKAHLNQLFSDMDMAAKRVAKIVTDLTDFARQPSATKKSRMQINTAVGNAIRLAQTSLNKSGIKVTLELRENLPLMKGNLQSIEQIVLNLTINAVQAIGHEHGEIKIVTGLQKKDGRVFISISDNGRGIDPSIRDKLFDPFVTDKQTKGGTGLGLSITHSLVKAHDGEITFQSEQGKGTTFTISFPTALKEKRPKILVVDDDKNIRDIISEALTTNRPYLVDEASNGVEACIKLGTYRPDLLILDIFMPKMDGLEVCRNITRAPELSRIKVIITTGFPDHPKLKEVAKLGFANVYSKPVKLQDLLKAVDGVLQG
jgi:signal transduction histidine kinase